MKIVLVGASGTIGSAVAKNLSARHEVIRVGKTSGDHQVDIRNEESIRQLFKQIGTFDALVSAAGDLPFADFTEMTTEQWELGLKSKLMGQINLARHAVDYLSDAGSITLTSGVLSTDPIAWGTAATTINAAIEAFALGASIELPRGIRINVVSPTVLTESMAQYGAFFAGHESVPAARVAIAFQKAVEGKLNGRTFSVVA